LAAVAIIVGGYILFYWKQIKEWATRASAKVVAAAKGEPIPNEVDTGIGKLTITTKSVDEGTQFDFNGSISQSGTNICQLLVGTKSEAIKCIYNGQPQQTPQPFSASLVIPKGTGEVYIELALQLSEIDALSWYCSGHKILIGKA